jgi:hypothetical protein
MSLLDSLTGINRHINISRSRNQVILTKQALTPLIIFIIAAGLAQGTRRHSVSYIAIKKEKAVTLNPLLPDVYNSFLLIYGRPATCCSNTRIIWSTV